MAKETYNEKRNSFAERLKTSTPSVPIQKVEPIAVEEPKEEEVQINAWIPKSLMKRIKTQAVMEELSIKQIVNKALEDYLDVTTAV